MVSSAQTWLSRQRLCDRRFPLGSSTPGTGNRRYSSSVFHFKLTTKWCQGEDNQIPCYQDFLDPQMLLVKVLLSMDVRPAWVLGGLYEKPVCQIANSQEVRSQYRGSLTIQPPIAPMSKFGASCSLDGFAWRCFPDRCRLHQSRREIVCRQLPGTSTRLVVHPANWPGS